jgi:hypothetical protein
MLVRLIKQTGNEGSSDIVGRDLIRIDVAGHKPSELVSTEAFETFDEEFDAA